MESFRVFRDVSQCFKSFMIHNVLLVVHDVLLRFTMYQCFTSVSCFAMFSESRTDRHRRMRCFRSPQGSRQRRRVGDNSAEIGDDAAGIVDDAAGIVDIAAKVVPC